MEDDKEAMQAEIQDLKEEVERLQARIKELEEEIEAGNPGSGYVNQD